MTDPPKTTPPAKKPTEVTIKRQQGVMREQAQAVPAPPAGATGAIKVIDMLGDEQVLRLGV